MTQDDGLPGQNANMLYIFVTDAIERGTPLFSHAMRPVSAATEKPHNLQTNVFLDPTDKQVQD